MRRKACLLFGVALAIRGLHFVAMQHSMLYDVLLGDAGQYDRWAQQIAAGDWLGSEVFYQTPLYPYLLGASYRVFGHDLWVVRIVQAVFGALSCVFLARAGAGFFSERVGWIAGIALALYPPAIFFDGILQKASLDLLLMTALLWLAAIAQQRPRASRFFGIGVVLGAMILNRENAAALLPVLLGWIAWCSWPRGALRVSLRCGIFALGAATVLVPVGLRNAYVGGEFLVTTSQMGSNFYIGNHRGADGSYTPMRAGRGDATFERDDARLIAEDQLKRALRPSEVSAYWMARCWDEIRSAPADWLRLLAWKWFLSWNRLELVDAEAIHTHQQHSRMLAGLGFMLHFGVLFPLAVMGVWWTRAQWRRLWLLYAMALSFAAAVTLFYVFARYRYPLVPIAALFAGAGLAGLGRQLRDHRVASARELGIGLALGAAAAVASNWPVPQRYADDSVTYYNAGTTLLEMGRVDDALDVLEQARRADPLFPETYNNLGRAFMEQGKLVEARLNLERGIALAPSHAVLHFNLAVTASKQGDDATARAMLAKAIELDPLLARAYGPLAELELRSGDVDSAIRRLQRAVELEPDAAVAHADLGLGLIVQGNLPEAVIELRAALRLDPVLWQVRNRLAWILATAADPQLRNGREALALAEETCRPTGCRQPELLQTLAAAYAASGAFGEAEKVAAEAIGLARASNEVELAERLERQSRSYRKKLPLRESAVTSERR